MTAKLSGPMMPPKSGGRPRQAMVLLHGYGSDGNDLIGLAGYWRDALPDMLFLAPNALEPCRDNPMGYQWFAIDHGRPEYRFDGAAAAQPVIAAFLADLWQQTGLAAGDTILAGFSQGAMMALHVGLALDQRVMGVVSFSGALIAPAGFAEGAGAKPPVCLIHGDRDQVVDPALSANAAATLRDRGFAVSYQVERGAAHSIAPDGLAYAGEFIAKLLAAG